MPRMTPSEALVETFVAEGVTEVFGIVGSAFMDALDLFPAAGIRFISVAHEQAAAHAADGLARVTGRPQVCIAQNGPGAANFVSAVTAAYWAHSPVVAVTPETGTMGIGTGGFQELDQMPMFAAQTKYQVRVNRPERMAELARRAFYMAKAEMGPTQLDIPRDYFYGDIETEVYPSGDVSRGAGSEAELARAAELLGTAKFPVILAGGGVVWAGGVAETKNLAEYLGAPVANSYLHNDSFPWGHDLSVGPIGYCGSQAAMRILSRADVVLALGCRLGPFGTLPQYDLNYWPEAATIIQVDADAKVLGLSRRVDLPVCADAREFAVRLLAVLKDKKPSPSPGQDRLSQVKEEKEAWRTELDSWALAPSKLMHPRAFLSALAAAVPPGAIVTTDVGNTCSMCNAYFGSTGPGEFLGPLSWGNCGISYGLALGAKLGRPAAPVFAVQGDGAWGISGLSEVMTAVREQIPVIAVVFNNNQWGAEKKNQIDYYDHRFVGANLANPDFAKLAEVMGAQGFRVEKADQVKDAVEAALASGRPAVIDAVIDGAAEVLAEPFRRDALQPPRRLLDKYKHLNAT
ncbi:MAG: sulfoacetaldehyde acetyltransferase [Proteobacteria bacterium]|nr:sulfoacetaldehyde acetyltransferase [Pseudomonadota bacterium]MBU1740671.1 sulfoacetaldehyde acetyltransferase [Pseudomonadota bacterium]